MLAATSSAPNSQLRPTPKPANWRGVTDCLRQARDAYQNQAYAESEQLLLELIEFAPSETRAWKLLANTQKAQGKIQQALASARRALDLQNAANQSDEMPASATLARLLWEQGEHDAARAMLGLLIMRQPENSELEELKNIWNREVEA